MTHTQFQTWLRGEAKRAGTQDKLASSLGVSGAMLSRVLQGKDAPPPKLLKAVRFERRTTYHRMKS